jgi:GNAT superfamily N-acetyltransferase
MIVMQDSIIRLIEEHDNAEVAELMAELGYAVSPELITQNIQDISQSDIDCAYVAEFEGQILGVISVHVLPLFHAAGKLGRITALVVSSSCQRAGVGSKLVEAAETFSRDKGCVKIEVTSGNHREGAHNFYRKTGYEQSSHGRFIKNL